MISEPEKLRGHRSHLRPLTSHYRKLDVRRLAREGWLTPGRTSWWHWWGSTVAQVRIDAEKERITVTSLEPTSDKSLSPRIVSISRTPCHLGGSRPWFLCPSFLCGRRVAVLYGGDVFRCRRCHQLAYDSTRESPCYRALRRARTIRKRLGGGADMTLPFPMKPRWMRWRTYDRLSEQALLAMQEYGRGLAELVYGRSPSSPEAPPAA